jgi:hypothetical protein
MAVPKMEPRSRAENGGDPAHAAGKRLNNGSRVLQYFAITAAWTGEKELALQQLETGLRAPSASIALSYGSLKLLPFWDPLRDDPRFEKIVGSLAPKETASAK